MKLKFAPTIAMSVRTVRYLVPLLAVLSIVSCTKSNVDPPNTLHIAIPEKIKGLDPIQADDLYSGGEVLRVYDSLYQYHYLKRPYQVVPNLTEAMPTISADGKTYTIKLKKGVLFQDDPAFKATGGKGRELVADDVIYSWKRLADSKNASPGWWVFDGKVVGLNEWRTAGEKSGAADYAAPIAGLKALDRYTIQMQLTQRSYQIVYAMAMSFTAIVPKEAVDFYGKEFLNHPVGTGAFKMLEFNPSGKLVYVKNPTYREELYPSEGEPSDQAAGRLADAGKRLPFADKLVVTVFVEQQPMWLTLMSGGLDYAGIPKDNFAQAIGKDGDLLPELKGKGMTLQKSPSLDVTHESFNMADPVVGKNKYLRQAMSLAYNPAQAIDLFYNGQAVAAQGPIPPGLAGYDPEFKNPYKQFNTEKAKELLAKAGYPGGKGLPPIEYQTTTSSTSRQMNEYLQKQMEAIGVTLKINASSWPEFQANVKNKKGQMWGFAWGADYPDAENFLQLFYSKNGSPGPNDANYSNPEFDQLYDKALSMQDGPERTALYQKMEKIVAEDTPWIFGVHRLVLVVKHNWLTNFKYHDIGHGMTKYYRIDPSLKK